MQPCVCLVSPATSPVHREPQPCDLSCCYLDELCLMNSSLWLKHTEPSRRLLRPADPQPASSVFANEEKGCGLWRWLGTIEKNTFVFMGKQFFSPYSNTLYHFLNNCLVWAEVLACNFAQQPISWISASPGGETIRFGTSRFSEESCEKLRSLDPVWVAGVACPCLHRPRALLPSTSQPKQGRPPLQSCEIQAAT